MDARWVLLNKRVAQSGLNHAPAVPHHLLLHPDHIHEWRKEQAAMVGVICGRGESVEVLVRGFRAFLNERISHLSR